MNTSLKSQDVPQPSPHLSATIQPKLLDMFMKTMKLNVSQCAEATPPPPPPLPADGKAPPPPPTPDAAAASDSIATAARAVSGFSNPGPYEQAINDVKRIVMVDTFEGFRCDISKQVSPFMAAIHSFQLGLPPQEGRKSSSSYSFITQVADESGLLMARIDPVKGSLDGRVHKALLGGLAMGKLQMGVTAADPTNEMASSNDTLMAEVDFGGNTWTGNLKYGSMGGGLVYGCNFFQTLHPNVAAGGEGMYIAANGNLMSSYTLKVNWKAGTKEVVDEVLVPTTPPPMPPGMPPQEEAGNSVLCLNYNAGQMVATINYKRCVAPNRLVLGADLQFNPMSLDSQVVLGAEYKWQRSKLNLCVDGAGRMQSLLEAKYGMAPGSPSILLSAEMDHYSDVMKFGYGINIES
jgi:mitochondrial import receptor subunit TOM40